MSSGLDLDFYAKANPGIAAAGVDPAQHYALFGRNEGRAANASELAQGLWSQVTRDQGSAAKAPTDPKDTKFANNPYGFDAKYYLDNNPDVAATKVDPLQHFLTYGINEGRARNDLDAAGGLGPTNIPAGIMAAPPQASAPLNPNDAASWAAFQQKAHAQTEGINRLPRVAPSTDTLSADKLAVLSQFYPKANNYGYVTPGYGGEAGGAATNLGMGALSPEMLKALTAQGYRG